MKPLTKNWFIEDLLDFEYKKYVLLAYLKEVQDNFHENRLYPYLSDLVFHYRNMVSFIENEQQLYHAFPGTISEVDIENFRLLYTKAVNDDGLMNEIREILGYSIPRIKSQLEEGKSIYEYIESKISLNPVGILPLYKQEGYLLLQDTIQKQTSVYEYQVTLFESADEKYRGVNTHYITTYDRNFINTFEYIKRDLIANIRKFPNPATYAVEITDLNIPLKETLIPIASRLLVKTIS